MDRQFWICQKSTKHEPLVLIEVQWNLKHFDTRRKGTLKQDRGSKSWGWQGGGQPSPFLKFFLTPSVVQLTPSTHPLYEMIEFQVTLLCLQTVSWPPGAVVAFPHPFQFTFLPPLQYPPLVPPPKNVFEIQENRNYNAGTRHDSPIPITHKCIQPYSPLPTRHRSSPFYPFLFVGIYTPSP